MRKNFPDTIETLEGKLAIAESNLLALKGSKGETRARDSVKRFMKNIEKMKAGL